MRGGKREAGGCKRGNAGPKERVGKKSGNYGVAERGMEGFDSVYGVAGKWS